MCELKLWLPCELMLGLFLQLLHISHVRYDIPVNGKKERLDLTTNAFCKEKALVGDTMDESPLR